MTEQQPWQPQQPPQPQQSMSQPLHQAGPPAVLTALIASAFIVVIAIVDTVLGIVKLTIAFGPDFSPILYTFIPTVLFALAAFLSLAFIKPVPLRQPVAAVAVPLLIAGGIGFIVLIVMQIIFATFDSMSGRPFTLNLGSVIATTLIYTLVLTCGALFARANSQAQELRAGVPVGQSSIPAALFVAGVATAESAIVTLLFSLGLIDFAMVLPWVGLALLRGAFFGVGVFLTVAFIRPLARNRGTADVAIGAVISGALGYAAMLLFGIAASLFQGGLGHFFAFTVFEMMVNAIDGMAVVALSILALLAWRGQRVLTQPQSPQGRWPQHPGPQNSAAVQPPANPYVPPQQPGQQGQQNPRGQMPPWRPEA
ncbi:hypothetical protein [Paramicrobacterium chengjingii]|uniref:Uncharacterized protein n=1 Tax=Paramicrobacterium chengjingii TaxID=2769067 RepID=A0ABX6YJ68_9MICO|nr:hypothetical protein [Microbacterium chengjingii]QPZ38849.1 hypothetical protein HCR76_01715 [Microbacterium chengjingii]